MGYRYWLIILCVVCVGFSMQADAQSREFLKIAGAEHASYSRVTFTCEQPVGFGAKLIDNSLFVSFDRSFYTDFRNLLQKMKHVFSTASLSDDGRIVMLKLNNNAYRIRRFVSDRFVGVDLVKTSPENSLPTANVNDFADIIPNKSIIPVKRPQNLAAKKEITKPKPNLHLTFSWHKKVAVAVFKRGDISYVIFDQPQIIEVAALQQKYSYNFTNIKQLPHQHYTILQFFHKKPNVEFIPKKNNYQWVLEIVPVKTVNAKTKTLSIKPKYNYAKDSHIFISVQGVGKPLRIKDPIIGDDIVVFPLYTVREGVREAPSWADIQFLKSTQGIIATLLSDKVYFNVTQDGVKIVTPLMKLYHQYMSAGLK